MKYDFTTMADRRGHDSIAVDLQENDFWTLPKGETKPGFDKIPMWIADMNFPTVPSVTEAIMQRVSHPIYGYFVPSDEYYNAIIRWHKDSFDVGDISKENAKQRTIAFYAPSKTFNLAGLVGSYHIVYDQKLSDELRRYEVKCHYNDMNVLSMHALIGAYTPQGREWMVQLKKVLEKNIELADTFFKEYVQGVDLRKPEGTYVIVPDFSEWCSKNKKTLDELLCAGVEVGVLWRDGRPFHIPQGIRMALGLPTKKLEEVLHRLKQYVL